MYMPIDTGAPRRLSRLVLMPIDSRSRSSMSNYACSRG